MPQILVPKFGSLVGTGKWNALEREFRQGNLLAKMLRREAEEDRARGMDRMTAVAAHAKRTGMNAAKKFGGDLEARLKSVIPLTEYIRWQQEDKDFWRDPKNEDRLIRDNPQMQPWKH